MSEEKNTQYVAMKTMNSTQIEPTVYETPYPSLGKSMTIVKLNIELNTTKTNNSIVAKYMKTLIKKSIINILGIN